MITDEPENTDNSTAYDDYCANEQEDAYSPLQYNVSVSPNDFNVATIFSYIESGAFKIPGFQRNYVWDIKRASKLIESLILGLPVPQIFLYEKSQNEYHVIDGHQRLMSIYYFIKKRFPKTAARIELRRIFAQKGSIPEDVIGRDDLFANFNLMFTERIPGQRNPFHGLNYATLGEHKRALDLRPIRCVMIKQTSGDDDSAIHEIFNRLNTGGVNLRPQEIRASLYDSEFMRMLHRVNLNADWRNLLNKSDPDLHFRDVEILLRGFAILIEQQSYSPSMVKFLNSFSKHAQEFPRDEIDYLEDLFESFLRACENLPPSTFLQPNNRINMALFEAVFAVACGPSYWRHELIEGYLEPRGIDELATADEEFKQASLEGTTSKANVFKRLERAKKSLKWRKDGRG
jgi:hypothetical protein